jgi:protein-arginine kinase activator protein McsA
MLKKVAILSSVIAAAAFISGCQSSGPKSNAAASTQAVACSQCKVTYVKVPDTGGKGRIMGYRTMKRMECPECRTAAENFFATGKLERTCKLCGDSMEMCEGH